MPAYGMKLSRRVVVTVVGWLSMAAPCAALAAPDTLAVAPDTNAVAPAPPAGAPDTLGGAPDTTSARAGAGERGRPEDLQSDISPEERNRLKESLDRMGRGEGEGNRAWERRKIPKVALFSSAALPGLGQVYNGRRIKVGIMVGVASYYLGNVWTNWKSAQRATVLRDASSSSRRAVYDDQIEFYKENSRDFMWWFGAVWVIGMIDAWVDAHLYDVRSYTPPPAVSLTATGRTAYVTFSVSF